MTQLKNHRYPKELVEYAIHSYRNGLSYREVQLLLKNNGFSVSYKTIYEWNQKFGRQIPIFNKNDKKITFTKKVVTVNGKKVKVVVLATSKQDQVYGIVRISKK